MRVQGFTGSGVQGFGGSAVQRFSVAVAIACIAAACSRPAEAPPPQAAQPVDGQHAGITTPHGDHTPHHGGMVLMNGEIHYEVVLDRGGAHRIWFSNAVREDLPASVASRVAMVVSRAGSADETIALRIDDSGESWLAAGQPVVGGDVMMKITYVARGEPYEVEVPFVAAAK